jgi:Holliday junction resolvasome RuvABC endonuclease subunit
MIIFGVDPGPTSSGWAVVECAGGRLNFLEAGSGNLDLVCDHVVKFLDPDSRGGQETYRFAVECPRPFFPVVRPGDDPGRQRGLMISQATQLIATARAVGEIVRSALARVKRDQIFEYTASEWRTAVCRRSNPTDAQVKEAITRLVAGWPSRSNAHHRDAAGVATAAAWWVRTKADGMPKARPSRKRGAEPSDEVPW